MKVIICIPAYNEENTLPEVIQEIKQVMNNTKYKYQILVTNDGSIDNTKKVAQSLGAKVISHKRNKGLTKTFKTEIKEFLKLKGDIFIHTDADGQYLAEDIPRLINEIKKGYDLVIGSRFYENIKHMPFMKKIGNVAFAKVFSKLLNQKITDTTTGFRAFTKQVAKDIKYINTFTYTQEQLIKAKKQKFKIKEIPIKTRKTRPSKLFKNPLEYAIKAWINILRIYRDYDPIKFFGKIGAFFLILGIFSGLFLVIKFIISNEVRHIPLTILTILFIILGVQIILFGFLADMKK